MDLEHYLVQKERIERLLERLRNSTSPDPQWIYEEAMALAAIPVGEFASLKRQFKQLCPEVNLNDLSVAVAEARHALRGSAPDPSDPGIKAFCAHVREVLDQEWYPIAHLGTDEHLQLRLWRAEDRQYFDVKLDSLRGIYPLLAIDGGSPQQWCRSRDITLPAMLQWRETAQGIKPRPPAEIDRWIAEQALTWCRDQAAHRPAWNRLTAIRNGVHWVDGTPVWVNGTDARIWHQQCWHSLPSPRWQEYILQDTNAWTEHEPDQICPLSPEAVYQHLRHLLETGWTWQQDIDPVLVALSAMKAAVADCFERQEILWITGKRGTGKSRLTKGLSGHAHFPKLIEAAGYETNVTQSGLINTYHGRSMLLMLDEFEKSQRRDDVLELLRSSIDAKTGILRGTPRLESQRRTLHCPAWVCSIDTLELDQDLDRVIRIDMPKDPDSLAPEIRVQQARCWERCPPDALRMGLTLCLLPHLERLRERYEYWKMQTLPGEELVGYRMKEAVLGLLAVAEVVGEHVPTLAQLIFQSRASQVAQQEAFSLEERLMQAILNTPLNGENETLRSLLYHHWTTNSSLSLPQHGMWYDNKTQTLILQLTTIHLSVLRYHEEFRGLNDRARLHLLQRHHACIHSQRRLHRTPQGVVRGLRFDVNALLEQPDDEV